MGIRDARTHCAEKHRAEKHRAEKFHVGRPKLRGEKILLGGGCTSEGARAGIELESKREENCDRWSTTRSVFAGELGAIADERFDRSEPVQRVFRASFEALPFEPLLFHRGFRGALVSGFQYLEKIVEIGDRAREWLEKSLPLRRRAGWGYSQGSSYLRFCCDTPAKGAWSMTRFLLLLSLAVGASTVGALTTFADDERPNPLPWPEAALRAFDAMEIPEGLDKSIVAAEPLVTDPVAFCFDGQGRIYVAETFRQERGVEDNRSSSYWLLDDLSLQTVADRLAMYEKWKDRRHGGMDYYREFEDRIRLVEDTDGNGVADTVRIYSDGYNDPLDGTGAGVLFDRGSIYYTNIPALYRLRDSDGDGGADQKEVMSTGYGVRIALRGHDMHGLVIGPDRRLYWSIGDRGYHVETPEGGLLHSPATGAVFRCELDGSGLEVFHHGLRNPQELAFDDTGQLFTVDNNSDGGDRARLVQIVDGGETGWQMQYQTLEGENRRGPWNQEKLWHTRHEGQPAWSLPPIAHVTSGPSGFTHDPGWGLPDRYRDHFFVCDFVGGASGSSVRSFALEPDGATYRMVDEHKFASAVLCTDVEFGYDGRIYISDWGAGWVQNGQGRIYAIEDRNTVDSPIAFEVSRLFREGFSDLEPITLATLLGHVDRRVRFEAQWALAEHPNFAEPIFAGAVTSPQSVTPRIHGLWGLGQLLRRDGVGERGVFALLTALEDGDGVVRRVAATVLADTPTSFRHRETVIARLIERLSDEDRAVQAAAAAALGRLGVAEAVEPLIDAARRNDDQDVVARHAFSCALERIGATDRLLELATDESAAVRRVAVLALRRLKDPRISVFLADRDESIVTECARAIYDVPIVEARAALADLLPRLLTGETLQPRSGIALHFEAKAFSLPDEVVADEVDPRDDRWFEGTPRETRSLEVADTGEGFGDRYACRMIGSFEITERGRYRFAICSDDQSVLYISELGEISTRRQVAHVDDWVSPGVFDARPSQVSEALRFAAGTQIEIEARQIEEGGLDHLQVAIQYPDGRWERPMGSRPEREGNLPLLRRVFAAALEVGGSERAELLARATTDAGLPDLARREALAILAQWLEPEPRERVQGEMRVVDIDGRDRDSLRDAVAADLLSLSVDGRGSVAVQGRRLAAELGVQLPVSLNEKILGDGGESSAARVAALEQLQAAGAPHDDSAREFALASDVVALRVRARELIPEADLKFAAFKVGLASDEITEQQGTLLSLGDWSDPRVSEVLLRKWNSFEEGTLLPELALELILAIEQHGSERPAAESLLRGVDKWRREHPADDEIAPYSIALHGGNAESGRGLFFDHPVAQCSRCHQVAGEGGVSGPPLDTVGRDRSREELLESIIVPNATITEGYGDSGGPSAMPQVHFALEVSEIRNLLEYLSTLRVDPDD